MNLKKRNDSSSPAEDVPKSPASLSGKQKPVFFYIVVLFGVAFALLMMSFFMHQRSNQEVLGELHNNVNALEQLQEALDENLRLEKALTDLQEQQSALQSQLDAGKADTERWQLEAQQNSNALTAMNQLYALQQEYAAKDYAACQDIIAAMEQGQYVAQLPSSPVWDGVPTTPAARYQQLKEAVAEKTAK